MSQTAVRTKWKFVVEFEDEETNEISGTIGQADTREECEGLLEHEIDYHSSLGRTVVNAEASEVCTKCQGEGNSTSEGGVRAVCDTCGGRLGAVAKLTAAFGAKETEFLLLRRGDFSGQFPPRRAA
jgi:hypothetical protein